MNLEKKQSLTRQDAMLLSPLEKYEKYGKNK